MAIGIGVHARSTQSPSALVCTTPTLTTQSTGSTFYIFVGWYGTNGTPTPTDSKTNTWGQVDSTMVSGSDGNFKQALFECVNGTGGTLHTFTTTQVTGVVVVTTWAVEVTGGLTSGIRDQTPAGNDDSASAYTSNTATTTQANELLLAFACTLSSSGTETLTWGGTPTFTSIGEDEGNANNNITGGIASASVSATGTYNSSFTSSGGGTTAAMTYLVTLKDITAGGSAASDSADSAGARQLRRNASYRMSPRSAHEAQQFLRAQKRDCRLGRAA